MFEKRKHQKDKLLVSENFGQINYFSRLSCYNDEHVNGLAFANITSYKHIVEKKVNGIEASGVYLYIKIVELVQLLISLFLCVSLFLRK